MALPGIRGLAGLRMFPRGLAAPGGGGPPPGPSVYEGLVANSVWGTTAQSSLTSSWRSFGVSVYTATSDIEKIRVAVSPMGKGANGLIGPSGGTATFGVGIEYPIVSGRRNTSGHNVQRCQFAGSDYSSGLGPKAVAITDLLTLATMIPKGAKFRIWTFVTYTGTGAGVCYRNNAWQNDNDGDWYITSNSGFSDPISTSTIPDIAATGTNAKPCQAIAIIGETVEPSIIAIGDSILHFSSLLGAQNVLDRVGMFKQVPTTVAALNLGIASISISGAASWRTWSELYKLLPYCSTFINQLGFNDGSSIGDTTRNTEQNYLASLATNAERRLICTITPTVNYSASHKGWTQIAGQSASAVWTQRDAYNENHVRALSSALSNYTGYLDVAEGFCDTNGRSGIFKVPSGGRQVSGVSYTINSTALAITGAAFDAGDLGYGWSAAASVGGGFATGAWIGSVTDADNATSGTNPAAASGSPGDFNVRAYPTDGVHPTQPLWDVTIPIIGMDDAATWARAA